MGVWECRWCVLLQQAKSCCRVCKGKSACVEGKAKVGSEVKAQQRVQVPAAAANRQHTERYR